MGSKILQDSIKALVHHYTHEVLEEYKITNFVFGFSAVGVGISNGGIGTCYSAVGEDAASDGGPGG